MIGNPLKHFNKPGIANPLSTNLTVLCTYTSTSLMVLCTFDVKVQSTARFVVQRTARFVGAAHRKIVGAEHR
ncbi:hypothetical protein SAMN05216327_102641, partial [Dyadobacter sp. SG02]|uniref:hypothetical protein n=1 Tax=Dyadobacter sp. SG02 TaxID=1855291 RepID=UPI0008BDDB59